MTASDAIKEIESDEFAARLNVAASIETFLRIAEEQESVRGLLSELDSVRERTRLFNRLLELSRSPADLRYENQWDVALAVYLWLLSLRDPGLRALAAAIVARTPQCWWAARISHYLLQQSYLHNDAGLVDSKTLVYQTIPFDYIGGKLSGEAIFSLSCLGEAVQVVYATKTAIPGMFGRVITSGPNLPYVYDDAGEKSGVAAK